MCLVPLKLIGQHPLSDAHIYVLYQSLKAGTTEKQVSFSHLFSYPFFHNKISQVFDTYIFPNNTPPPTSQRVLQQQPYSVRTNDYSKELNYLPVN